MPSRSPWPVRADEHSGSKAGGRETTFKPYFEEASMDFRPLAEVERRQLLAALWGNADRDLAILMDRRDTSFAGTTDNVSDEEVITCIKSVPCHY
jgi:hypothetical protein